MGFCRLPTICAGCLQISGEKRIGQDKSHGRKLPSRKGPRELQIPWHWLHTQQAPLSLPVLHQKLAHLSLMTPVQWCLAESAAVTLSTVTHFHTSYLRERLYKLGHRPSNFISLLSLLCSLYDEHFKEWLFWCTGKRAVSTGKTCLPSLSNR